MDANPQWELDHTVELVAVLERIQVREPQMGGM
jgi:hypothetical protein